MGLQIEECALDMLIEQELELILLQLSAEKRDQTAFVL
jgi:hypothetical protein